MRRHNCKIVAIMGAAVGSSARVHTCRFDNDCH
jgi:hypothetical protein